MALPSAYQAMKAYADVGLEAKINAATPLQIVVMLYEGAMGAVATAKGEIEQKHFAEKSHLINKAIDIVEGLRVALDMENGGEVCQNLHDLYEYIKYRLTTANVKNDPVILDEVHHLLDDLYSAWKGVADLPQNRPSIISESAGVGSYGKV